MRGLVIGIEQDVDARELARGIYNSLCDDDNARSFARELILHLGEYDHAIMNEFVGGVSDAMSEFDQEGATS